MHPAAMHPAPVEKQLASGPAKLDLLDGLPVVSRKITVELDSDDQRLLELKATKHTSRQMAVIFKEEGRRPLNEKSFYSRYKRITDMLAAKNDYLLEEKLAKWTNEEVHQLITLTVIFSARLLINHFTRTLFLYRPLRNVVKKGLCVTVKLMLHYGSKSCITSMGNFQHPSSLLLPARGVSRNLR